ncbi:MAG: system fructose-specific component [Firmicutes bacterium]|nr:system fructose-specific component [Bacillota bacterium]
MSIKELISPETISLELQATDADSAIQELAAVLARSGAVSDLSAYVADVRTRERHSTTAVGFGVAIPHAKSAGVSRAAVAFGRAKAGLNWSSLDGEPVHMVFLIAAPEGANDVHLKALAQLARMLMHEEVREGLLAANTPDQVLAALG